MNKTIISRRVFIGASSYLVSAPALIGALSAEADIFVIEKSGKFFSAHEITILADVAELMIPRTDTPGASDAFVLPVLDDLMLTWAGDQTKLRFKALVNQIDEAARSSFGHGYKQLSKSERTTLISRLDNRAFEKTSSELSQAYRKFKKMVFHIYYTSEQANPDFMLVPGNYRGCVTREELEQFKKQGRVT